MKRCTISMSDDLAEALAHEARRRDVSVSEIARDALMVHLGLEGGRARPRFIGLGRSRPRSATSPELEGARWAVVTMDMEVIPWPSQR